MKRAPFLFLPGPLRSIGSGSLLRLAGMGLRFLGTLALTRALGVEDYGVFVFLLVATQLTTLPAVNGFRRIFVRDIGGFIVRGRSAALRALAGPVHWTVVGGIALVGAATAGLLALGRPEITVGSERALLVVALTPAFMALVRVNEGLVRGVGHDVESQFYVMVLRPGLLLVLTGSVLVLAGPDSIDPTTALGLSLLAFAATAAPARWRARILVAPNLGDAGRPLATGAWFRSAVPFLLVGTSQTLQESAGVLVLGWSGDERAVGHFHAANRLSELVEVAYMASVIAVEGRIARLTAGDDLAAVARLTTRIGRAVAAVTAVLACLMIVLAQPLLSLFGPDFVGAAPVLVVLALMVILGPALGFADVILAMTDQAPVVARVTMLTAALNVILTIALVPVLGAVGAALAMAIALVPGKLYMTVIVRRRTGVDASILGLHARSLRAAARG